MNGLQIMVSVLDVLICGLVSLQAAKAGLGPDAMPPPTVPAWRIPKPRVERPPTPTFDGADEDGEEAALAAAVVTVQVRTCVRTCVCGRQAVSCGELLPV
jgi:hypothetical protein